MSLGKDGRGKGCLVKEKKENAWGRNGWKKGRLGKALLGKGTVEERDGLGKGAVGKGQKTEYTIRHHIMLDYNELLVFGFTDSVESNTRDFIADETALVFWSRVSTRRKHRTIIPHHHYTTLHRNTISYYAHLTAQYHTTITLLSITLRDNTPYNATLLHYIRPHPKL